MARRRSLSGSPEHHLTVAKKAAASAAGKFNLAEKFAKHGNCDAAFDAFIAGAAREGAAIAHDSESGLRLSVSDSGKMNDAYHAAMKKFKAVCGVGSKLSGLSGRRRRRRQ